LPSPLKDLIRLFGLIGLENYSRMADLGSGDGRVVLLASLYTSAEGLEADPRLVAIARAWSLFFGLKQASFKQTDFTAAELDGYDLLFIYPDKPLGSLVEKLARGFKGRLLVYGPFFSAGDLVEIARFDLEIHQARLFVAPGLASGQLQGQKAQAVPDLAVEGGLTL